VNPRTRTITAAAMLIDLLGITRKFTTFPRVEQLTS
jgi:hypothetical protein